MRYIGIIILLVLCLTLLLLTGCRTNTVKPEPACENLENQEDINQSSNNSQSSSTGQIYETVIADTEDTEMIYPQKWATGTGTASNPWANDCIKKAYNAVPTGGTIFLKAGYYQLADALVVQKSINIIGEGMDRTIIRTADSHGFYVRKTDYVTIKGMTVDGTAQDEHKDGIWFDLCDYAIVEDIEVKNVSSFGLALDTNYSYFHNIYSHDNYEHGMHSCPEIVGRNTNNTFRDIYCWNNGLTTANSGFDMVGYESVDDTTVHNNVYDNIRCWDNGAMGIALQYLDGCTLSNSVVSGNAGKGAYISLSKNMNIKNCDVFDNGEEGIGLYDLDDVNLTNVISRNNNTLEDGYSGINIWGCSDIVMASCQSYDDKETPLQEYGIYVGDGNSTITLLNCKLSPNKNGEIYDPTGAVVTVITDKMLAKF